MYLYTSHRIYVSKSCGGYCVIRSKLWSRSMLSGCRRSSLVRHSCVVPHVVCHLHRYDILMACTPPHTHICFFRQWCGVFVLV